MSRIPYVDLIYFVYFPLPGGSGNGKLLFFIGCIADEMVYKRILPCLALQYDKVTLT